MSTCEIQQKEYGISEKLDQRLRGNHASEIQRVCLDTITSEGIALTNHDLAVVIRYDLSSIVTNPTGRPWIFYNGNAVIVARRLGISAEILEDALFKARTKICQNGMGEVALCMPEEGIAIVPHYNGNEKFFCLPEEKEQILSDAVAEARKKITPIRQAPTVHSFEDL